MEIQFFWSVSTILQLLVAADDKTSCTIHLTVCRNPHVLKNQRFAGLANTGSKILGVYWEIWLFTCMLILKYIVSNFSKEKYHIVAGQNNNSTCVWSLASLIQMYKWIHTVWLSFRLHYNKLFDNTFNYVSEYYNMWTVDEIRNEDTT